MVEDGAGAVVLVGGGGVVGSGGVDVVVGGGGVVLVGLCVGVGESVVDVVLVLDSVVVDDSLVVELLLDELDEEDEDVELLVLDGV